MPRLSYLRGHSGRDRGGCSFVPIPRALHPRVLGHDQPVSGSPSGKGLSPPCSGIQVGLPEHGPHGVWGDRGRTPFPPELSRLDPRSGCWGAAESLPGPLALRSLQHVHTQAPCLPTALSPSPGPVRASRPGAATLAALAIQCTCPGPLPYRLLPGGRAHRTSPPSVKNTWRGACPPSRPLRTHISIFYSVASQLSEPGHRQPFPLLRVPEGAAPNSRSSPSSSF